MKKFKVEVVEGKDSHVDAIVGNLRKADRDEVMSATGKDPDIALIDAWKTSVFRWAILLDGIVIGVFGVSETSVKDIGVPWLLGTDKMKEIKISFVRQCKIYIDSMLDRFDRLINYVDARNTDSIKWLRWCGFHVFEPLPYGVDGDLFCMFFKKRGLDV